MAQTAQAADNGAWSAAPTKQGTFTARQYFFLELSPGATVKDSVTVKNAGQVAQVLDLYPADAFNVESGAGFALREAIRTLTLDPGLLWKRRALKFPQVEA
jgi:hypothetical protein